jgi:hypothetical protein
MSHAFLWCGAASCRCRAKQQEMFVADVNPPPHPALVDPPGHQGTPGGQQQAAAGGACRVNMQQIIPSCNPPPPAAAAGVTAADTNAAASRGDASAASRGDASAASSRPGTLSQPTGVWKPPPPSPPLQQQQQQQGRRPVVSRPPTVRFKVSVNSSCCRYHLPYMERPTLVMAWMHELLLQRQAAGGLAMPAPILARVYQV